MMWSRAEWSGGALSAARNMRCGGSICCLHTSRLVTQLQVVAYVVWKWAPRSSSSSSSSRRCAVVCRALPSPGCVCLSACVCHDDDDDSVQTVALCDMVDLLIVCRCWAIAISPSSSSAATFLQMSIISKSLLVNVAIVSLQIAMQDLSELYT